MNTAEFIKNIVKEQTEEPMSLFLSYAHRESMICRLIMLALKERGHHVWFDELNIPHGSDWRREIVRGIEQSGGVLSMLSKDAIRPGGVCLDELSIAVGVRGGNIRTVLLEKNITPPPTVMDRQWLDLTEWQDFRTGASEEADLLDDPLFVSWFKEKVNLIIQMLETRQNREFEGQITAIRNALPLLYTAVSRQSFLLKESYVERTWMREQVDQWLDDPEGDKLLVIYGDPGIGKSAFAAHYAHYNGRTAAAVFCERGQDALNSPEAVIETLAYKLACRLEDYREYLASFLTGRNPISEMNADELFEVLLAAPLSSLINGNRGAECILIDGIDETGTVDQNVLASVIQKYAQRLPEWLRILVLTRNVPAVRNWFTDAGYINLSAAGKENLADIELFIHEGLKEFTNDPQLLKEKTDEIVSRCEGIFLYARMILNALKEGKVTLDEADSFPQGLNGIFLRWFQWYFPDVKSYDEKIRPALSLMITSSESIPEEEIIDIAQWRKKQMAEFKRQMMIHLRFDTNEFGKDIIEFNHLFIREWLQSEAAGEYQIFEDDGIQDMASFFEEMLDEEEPEISEYEALNIPVIMEKASGINRSMRRLCKELQLNEALMKRQEELGKQCILKNTFFTALRYLNNALTIAENRTEEEDIAENRKHLVICKNRIAQIKMIQGQVKEALALNEEALLIAKQNMEERGLLEDRRRAAVAMIIIADTLPGTERAFDLYLEAREILLGCAEEASSDDEKVFRNLAIVHNRIGEIYIQKNDPEQAVASYREDLKISMRIARETGKRNARRDISVSYFKLADVYQKYGIQNKAKEYYDLALKTMEFLIKDHPLPDEIRGLAVLLNARIRFITDEERSQMSEDEYFDLLMNSYERSLTMSKELAENYGLVQDHLNEAASLANMGNLYLGRSDSSAAVSKWKEAYNIYSKYKRKEADILQKMISECEV